MRPFLLLATRLEDPVADTEYRTFCEFSGLAPELLHRVRLERDPLPSLRLNDYAGILLGGGPFNSSDPEETKSPLQQRVEADLNRLLAEVTERDFPFLGACYGVGTLGRFMGGVVDRTYGEPVGPATISLTPEGASDPLCRGLPAEFDAFVGHKEALRKVPAGAVVLASSVACPVQMFRMKQNLYATQFHPELDAHSLEERIRTYVHEGYFRPDEVDDLVSAAHAAHVEHPRKILANFVERYAAGPWAGGSTATPAGRAAH